MQWTVKSWPKHVNGLAKFFPFTKQGEVIELRNEEGQLHCLDGPAYRSHTEVSHWELGKRHGYYADRGGTVRTYFRGVSVPKHFIDTPESVTFEEIMSCSNVEVRRVGCELYGYERMETEKKMKRISSGDRGVLFEVGMGKNIPENEDSIVRFVKVVDGTPDPRTGDRRKFFLQVPPGINDADEAVAWTFGKGTKEEYNPVVEA